MIIESIIAILLTFAGCCFAIASLEIWEALTAPKPQPPERKPANHMRINRVDDTDGFRVSALRKDGNVYLILWDKRDTSQALFALKRWAESRDLNFSHEDADAVLVQMQEQLEEVDA